MELKTQKRKMALIDYLISLSCGGDGLQEEVHDKVNRSYS